MAKLAGDATYDLLLLDYELPGTSGIELLQCARPLKHRCSMPVVIFSGSDVVTEARCAGVEVFLRKPDDTHAIVGTVSQLLAASSA